MNRKADFFYKTNRFESIRLKRIGESIRIANRNALVVIPTRSRAPTLRAALTSASSPNTSTEVTYALLSVCTSTSVLLLLLLQIPRK